MDKGMIKSYEFPITLILTFDLNGESHGYRMVENYTRNCLKSSTGVNSSMGCIQAIESKSANEDSVSSQARS